MTVRDKNGKWINSSLFKNEALKFERVGAYCSSPFRTPDWMNYWEEQLRRCREGYEIEDENGIHKITGHHYFYLNFSRIEKVVHDEDDESNVAHKETLSPDFWDGDYDFFWALEIAKNGLFTSNTQVPSTKDERREYNSIQKEIKELKKNNKEKYQYSEEYLNLKKRRDLISLGVLDRLKLRIKPSLDHLDGGYHLVVAKCRRKGYSYKNSAICANIYNSVKKAQIIIGAFEKKFLYPEGTMGMASECLNFLNEYTGWTKSRDYVDKIDHKRASYKETVNGRPIERGYKSQIFAYTLKDNPEAIRGKDAKIVLFEEAGAFPNLKDSYNATYPGLTGGSYITGQIIIFGTGGDMGYGTADYADMFYNPLSYRLMPFHNIWDNDAENTLCGFFHSILWNMEGFYDKQGNSDTVGALEFEQERRDTILKNSSSSSLLEKHVQEFPTKPAEAFLVSNISNLPVIELKNQLNKVIQERLQQKYGIPVFLERKDGKVVAKPDLKNELKPIYNYKPKIDDISGAVVIYEYPMDNPPRNLYKIGYDPYRQDLSKGVSLGAILVYKSFYSGLYTKNIIVAEYVGRPQEADDVNRTASMLADLYNCEIMHENEVTHVKNYFRRIKRLDQLAAQPDNVISKSIKESTVARVYGCHMVDKIKEDAEKYLKDWLLQIRDYDENGNPILNLETIYSIGLLEELIRYNRKGNFDRVISFFMVLIQLQEEELDKDYSKSSGINLSEIINYFDNKE